MAHTEAEPQASFPEITYIQAVDTLGLCEEAATIERAARLTAVQGVLAERALDLAPDPKTPQGEARQAEHLYERVVSFGTEPREEASVTTAETLTPEQQKLRADILATFDTGYDAYAADHSIKWASGDVRPIASKEEAIKELEEDLTVDVLDVIAADIARNKEADPRAAFDIVMVNNKDFTADEETAIAEALQSDLPYEGEPYLNENYHNDQTAMKAVASGKKLRFAYAPRHANVPEGDAKTQKQWLEDQNADGNGVATLRSPEDVEAMAHFRVLLNAGELNDPNTRFDNTYSRRVEDYKEKNGRPVGDFVAYSYVSDGGQLSRGSSRVDDVRAGRALVVSNSNL